MCFFYIISERIYKLDETTLGKGLLNDELFNRLKDNSDILSVSCTSYMWINLFLSWISVQGDKLFLDVIGGSIEVTATSVVWEGDFQINFFDFFV